jgi:hypothetical protein
MGPTARGGIDLMAFSRTHHIKGALLTTHSGRQTRQRDDECQHNKTGVRHISSLSTLIRTLRKPLLRPYLEAKASGLISYHLSSGADFPRLRCVKGLNPPGHKVHQARAVS